MAERSPTQTGRRDVSERLRCRPNGGSTPTFCHCESRRVPLLLTVLATRGPVPTQQQHAAYGREHQPDDERHRARHVAAVSRGESDAPIQRSVTQHSVEPDGADDLPMKRSSDRGFAPARIRSQQQAVLTKAHAPSSPTRVSGKHRSQRSNDQPCGSGRQIVHDVIESRAAPTEAEVAGSLVPDHRVHRADNLEQHEAGGSQIRRSDFR